MSGPNRRIQTELVQNYIDRGWVCFPIPLGSKKPNLKDWPNLSLEKCRSLWIEVVDSNVGVLLGQPSGNGRYLDRP